MKDASLAALFQRYRTHGDGRALATIFDRTAKELLDLACHLVRDPLEAEDLVQATFVTAIQKGARYDGSTPLQGWLYGILWREAARARRRAARRVEPQRLPERQAADPTAAAAEGELPEAVSAVLARLPRHYREVLEPLLFEERRPEHIARTLGRSPGTVRSQIHRGLEELRRALAPRFAAHGLLALPTRGLASVRAEVLRAAGCAPTTAALGSLATLGLTLGGALASKAVVVGAAATLASLAVAWVALEGSGAAARGGTALEAEAPLAAAATTAHAAEARPASTNAPARSAGDPGPAAAAVRPAAPPFEQTLAHWLARYQERPDDWRHGLEVTGELAALPPDEALALLTALWPHLSVPVKEQALKPFVFDGGHVHALQVLHLAATDAVPSVQERAFDYLESYAFRDFALDYEGYLSWAETNRRRPVGEVLSDSARLFVAEMLAGTPAARAERLLGLRQLDLRAGGPAGVDLAAVMRAAGGLRLLEVALGDANVEVQRVALRWSGTLGAGEGWLRSWVVPVIEQPSPPELVAAAFDALARKDCGWAQDVLLGYLERATLAEASATAVAGRALAEIGDPAAIPRMIGILLRDRTGKLAYDVGYFGLAKLTGVTWQKTYDGTWWAEWWEKNRRRFPAEVAGIEVR
ncbi:MAG TPA: RNA polymerase sigma factor [Planctomycetota bacterium]